MYNYKELSEAAREAVTEQEWNTTVDRAVDTLDDFSDHGASYDEDVTWDRYAIASNLRNWAINKAPKIKAMKAHPSYNPDEPFKIIHEVDAVRELDDEAIAEFAESYNDYALERRPLLCSLLYCFDTTFVTQRQIESFNYRVNNVCRMLDEIEKGIRSDIFEGDLPDRSLLYAYYPVDELTPGASFEVVRDHGVLITKELIEKINRTCSPHEGQKVSKFARKLIMTIAGHVDEKAFAKYADALNPTIFKRKAVFSVDPVDYLLASNGNSWSSCYCINKYKDREYDGMYSNGTWSYMGDPSTIIMYIVDNDVTSNFAGTPKIARQCVFFNDEDLIVNSRVYPGGERNDNTRREFRTYAQQFICELFGLPNNWAVKETSWGEMAMNDIPTTDLIEQDSYFVGYADPRHFEMSFSLNKAREALAVNAAPKKIVYGHKAYCPVCGGVFEDNGRYVCEDCDEARKRCAGCGDRFYDDDLYYCEDTGDYRCSDCCTYCERYDEYYSNECTSFDTVHMEGRYGTRSETWCMDAIENDAFTCNDCGEYWRDGDGVLVHDSYGIERWVCPECAADYAECDECGERYGEDDLKEFVDPETGEVKMLCPDCYEVAMEKVRESEEVA